MLQQSINQRYNSKLDSNISDVISYILEQNYGTTIQYEKLSRMLGYNLEDEKEKKRFQSTMSRIRNHLIEKGYVLRPIAGVGYYIMKPKQISGYCYHTYICKLDNLLCKNEKILKHVDKLELSQIRKKEHKEVGELNKDLKDNVAETVRSSLYFQNKSVYDNLND